MSLPLILITRFFQLITENKFAEAERLLLEIKGRSSTSEWNKGYITALEGMLSAMRSGDDRCPIRKINVVPDAIRELREVFMSESRIEVRDEFDKGYFTAWSDYTKVLGEWKPWEKRLPPSFSSPSSSGRSQHPPSSSKLPVRVVSIGRRRARG